MVYTSEYPIFYVTVDVVLLTARDGVLCTLVIRRGGPPYEGRWAFPGGFVEVDEDLEHAARRELREETSVSPDDVQLEQLATYGAPDRDPRHRTISVAWLGLLPRPSAASAGSDAADAAWQPVAWLLDDDRLAFDHATILRDALGRVRSRPELAHVVSDAVAAEPGEESP